VTKNNRYEFLSHDGGTFLGLGFSVPEVVSDDGPITRPVSQVGTAAAITASSLLPVDRAGDGSRELFRDDRAGDGSREPGSLSLVEHQEPSSSSSEPPIS
jgi:hypothetical protein